MGTAALLLYPGLLGATILMSTQFQQDKDASRATGSWPEAGRTYMGEISARKARLVGHAEAGSAPRSHGRCGFGIWKVNTVPALSFDVTSSVPP